jgi:hypothetical protein
MRQQSLTEKTHRPQSPALFLQNKANNAHHSAWIAAFHARIAAFHERIAAFHERIAAFHERIRDIHGAKSQKHPKTIHRNLPEECCTATEKRNDAEYAAAARQIGAECAAMARQIGVECVARVRRIGAECAAMARRIGVECAATARRIGVECAATARRIGVECVARVRRIGVECVARVRRIGVECAAMGLLNSERRAVEATSEDLRTWRNEGAATPTETREMPMGIRENPTEMYESQMETGRLLMHESAEEVADKRTTVNAHRKGASEKGQRRTERTQNDALPLNVGVALRNARIAAEIARHRTSTKRTPKGRAERVARWRIHLTRKAAKNRRKVAKIKRKAAKTKHEQKAELCRSRSDALGSGIARRRCDRHTPSLGSRAF